MDDSIGTGTSDLVGRFEAEHRIPGAMRADVRLLGDLLGQVLRESGSAGLYDDVERLRRATIQAYTDETSEAFARAAQIVESFSIQRADEVARAFTAYFHLVNLAEEHQRVRVLRERDGQSLGDDPSASIGSSFAQLSAEIGVDAATERLQAMRFHPVFTAHPTEARRRAVSSSIRRLAEFLGERDLGRGGAEEVRIARSMLEEVDTLWRTAPLRTDKPTPVDEVRSIMAVFDETLYTSIPEVYQRIEDVLRADHAGDESPIVRPFVRLGTWVGGDRDGNPFVTASVTRKAAGIASEHVLLGLERTHSRLRNDPADGCAAGALGATAVGRRRGRERNRQAIAERTAPARASAARPTHRRYSHPRRRSCLCRSCAVARPPGDRSAVARERGCPSACVWRTATVHLAGRDLWFSSRRARGTTAFRSAQKGAR